MVDSHAGSDRADARHVITLASIDRPRVVVQDAGTIRTIAVSGELDPGSADHLATLLDDALMECRHVVLDISRAKFVDSAGAHLPPRTHTRAHERWVGLSIVPARKPVQRVFEVCGVVAILLVAGGVQRASGRAAAGSRA
jgi:anti-anti-sigma factor